MALHSTYTVIALDTAVLAEGTNTTVWLDFEGYNELEYYVLVTAENGTATLDITPQTSPDATTNNAYNRTALAQISAVGRSSGQLTNFGKYLRFSYVVAGSGTPSMTTKIVVTAKT